MFEKLNGKKVNDGKILCVERAQKTVERQLESERKFEEIKSKRLNRMAVISTIQSMDLKKRRKKIWKRYRRNKTKVTHISIYRYDYMLLCAYHFDISKLRKEFFLYLKYSRFSTYFLHFFVLFPIYEILITSFLIPIFANYITIIKYFFFLF